MADFRVEELRFLWAVLVLPLGWLFILLSNHIKEAKTDRDTFFARVRESEADVRSIELRVNSIEQGYITDSHVRGIIKEEFQPIREEYTQMRLMLAKLGENLVSLEKEIVKMNARNDE